MLNEQERLLPIANVGRIMKRILPARAKISKEAKETVQECVSEFISFVTDEASAKCLRENRRTIDGEDICWSLSSLGFDIYTEAMLRYLQKYRAYERQKALVIKASNGDEDEASTSNNRANTATVPMAAFEFINFLEKDPSSLVDWIKDQKN